MSFLFRTSLVLASIFIPMFCSSLAQAYAYQGEFSQVAVQGEGCNEVFAALDYKVQVYPIGTSRNVLMHFSSVADATPFFNGVSFTSLYGPDGDVYADRNVLQGGESFATHLQGIVDYNVIFVEVKVQKKSGGTLICSASAEFNGFRM